MGLWRLLGGEVNWERVARMQNRAHLKEIHSAIINALDESLNIDRLNDDDKNNVMWVLTKFGREVPTTSRYSWLKPIDDAGAGNLHPKRSEFWQKYWDKAWEWYDAYKKGGVYFQQYRIQLREKKLEHDEKYLQEIKLKEKISRNEKYLLKSYEKDIPKQRSEIFKLKRKLVPLQEQETQYNRLRDLQEKAQHYGVPTRTIKEAIECKQFVKEDVDRIVGEISKQISDEKQNNSFTQQKLSTSDLSLENENLRLKKEILEMELKLKAVNR